MKLEARLVTPGATKEAQGERKPPIEGRFLVEFVSAESKPDKKGNDYLRLGMKVLEGEEEGRTVYSNLFPTYTFRGAVRFKPVFSGRKNPGLLQILGLKLTSEGFDEQALVGRQIVVYLESDGQWQNIGKFESVES